VDSFEFCSMSCFECFIQCLSIVIWILLLKGISKMVNIEISGSYFILILNLKISKWLVSMTIVLFFVFFYYYILFPARNFFNSFREDHEMMHSRDLQKLEGVLSPTHLEVDAILRFCVTFSILNVVKLLL